MGGGPSQEIIPLRGSILQAETCQILSLAENPRWSPSVAINAMKRMNRTIRIVLSSVKAHARIAHNLADL